MGSFFDKIAEAIAAPVNDQMKKEGHVYQPNTQTPPKQESTPKK